MNLSTQFESGSGRLTQLAEHHWRLDTAGDRFGYNRYFCVHIDNRGQRAATLRLEVHPDPELAQSHFMTHFPSHLWYSAGESWTRWVPVRHTWEDAVTFHDDRIEVRLPLAADAVLLLATNPPLRYSDLMKWIEGLQAAPLPLGGSREGGSTIRRLELQTIGRSSEDRPIHAIRLGQPGKPRLLVLAGMHSSEHSGVYAAQGIVDYLLSRCVDARPIVAGFDIAVVPMLNPDGNVHGHSGGTVQRTEHNNSLDFQDAAAGVPPQVLENHLLWQWLRGEFAPDLSLHFHGYMGWRRAGDHPCDGLYALPEPQRLLRDPRMLRTHQAILDRMKFDTPAMSSHFGACGTLSEQTLEWQMSLAFQTVGVLYEVNCGSVGVSEQYRRGPEVLRALALAALEDAPLPARAALAAAKKETVQ